MSLRESAESAAQAVFGVLDTVPHEDQANQVADVIEQTIINAVLTERERCTTVAVRCCSEDQDRAHKIAAELRLDREVLIANLSAMR